MANGYEKHLTIDRIDNDGHYAPGNCRWVSRKVQANNTSQNIEMTLWGETKNISQWLSDARCIVTRGALRGRLRFGWDLERALTTPPRPRSPKKPPSDIEVGKCPEWLDRQLAEMKAETATA